MEEEYRRLEESCRRLEEQCGFYEERCKVLEEENKALKERCDAYGEEKMARREKRSKAAKEGWRNRKEGKTVTPRRLKNTIAWQKEEARREEFQANLYPVETVSFQKPTEEQVYECMHIYAAGAWYIDARDEARQFMDFYDANGWMMGQDHMRDWRAAARNWINMRLNKIKNGNNRQKQADYENDRAYYAAIRSIDEDARYRREHGEEKLPF